MVEPNTNGRPPDPDVGPAPQRGEAEFTALIDDQRARWVRGEPVTVEHYLEHNPSLRAREDTILDLIYNEVVLREEMGEAPGLEEYQRRFPRWAPQLAVQFEVHRAITSPSQTGVDSGSTQPPRGADPDEQQSTIFGPPDGEEGQAPESFDTTAEFD